jgi:hypothetical protein
MKEINYMKEKLNLRLGTDAVKQEFRPYFSKDKGLKVICEISYVSGEEDMVDPEDL